MSLLSGFLGILNTAVSTTIAAAGTTSAAISTGGFSLCGVKLPAAFTGTAISFTMCDTVDGTYVPVKSTTSGSALSYTVAQGTYAALDPKDFQGIAFLKIVSNATEGSLRTLVLSMKGI
jgi:hypothetical protein